MGESQSPSTPMDLWTYGPMDLWTHGPYVERIEQQLERPMRLGAELGAEAEEQHSALSERHLDERVAAGELVGAHQPAAHQQLPRRRVSRDADHRRIVCFEPA